MIIDTDAKLNKKPQILSSSGFAEWLSEHNISLAFTARRINKLFLMGVNPEGGLSLFERTLSNPSGLAVYQDHLFASSLSQIWQLNNILLPGQVNDGYDRIYRPHCAYTTGDCATHEMAVTNNHQLVFVNTRFSCLATLSTSHSFKPIWKPEFISQLVPEDRCHLNGLALKADDRIGYVTVCGTTDLKEGWRETRNDTGCLIDVNTNKVVLDGLCMPHSPRIYQDNIWLLNSGHGQLGTVDLNDHSFNSLITCPGFLRGLEFIDHYAIVTVSKPRAAKVFSGLPLDKALDDHQLSAECGILVIDLDSGQIIHRVKFDSVIEELMDVKILHHCKRPMLLGFNPDDTKNVFNLGPLQSHKKPGEDNNPILV